MDQTTTTTQTTGPKPAFYNLAGTAIDVSRGKFNNTRKTPYARITFRTVLRGTEKTITAMASGKGLQALKGHLRKGRPIRLNGLFKPGTTGGTTFVVVGLGPEPKPAEAAAPAAA
jgi:hypothetical protein